jgi:hypothetical protein
MKSVLLQQNLFYLVSRLLNFFVITLPGSKPSRVHINFVNSGWDEPPKTFIFGILVAKDGWASNVDGDIWLYDAW